jgi:branched-chain amino acid transport system permease protein
VKTVVTDPRAALSIAPDALARGRRTFARNAAVAVGVIGILFALNALVEGVLSGYVARIVILSGISVTLAVSLNLINGYTGQFSLGHAGFMAVGAYVSSAMSYYWGNLAKPGQGAVLEFLIGTLRFPEPVAGVLFFALCAYAGGVAASLSGLLVGVPTLRLKGDYLAIATLGFGEIIRVVLLNLKPVGGSLGFSDIPGTGSPRSIFENPFIWVAATAIACILFSRNMVESTRGRAFLAVRDDEVAAESIGISTTRYKVTAFVVSAFFAGVAGALVAHYDSYLHPESFNFIRSIEVVVMVVLGGMGSLTGVTLAAIGLTILPELLRASGPLRMVLYSLLLIVLMLVRPQGLMGHRTLRARRKTRPAHAAAGGRS